jgi:hypothetical protein
MTTETYTHQEIDQLSGGLLFIGGIHAALGHVLDVLNNRDDLALVEFLNHAPVGLVEEVLPVSALIIDEVARRLDALRGAVVAAIDSAGERRAVETGSAAVREKFDSIMVSLFSEQATRDGLT